MLRLALLAGLAVAVAPACRYSLEDGEAPSRPDASLIDAIDAGLSPSCLAATMRSDLAFIEDTIYRQSCTFQACHDGAGGDPAARLNLRPGMSFTAMVNVDSALDPAHKLVVPGQPNQSYLLMMIQHIAPADMDPPTSAPPTNVGYMPQNVGGASLCVEKRDAIQRWIEAGALAN